MKKTIYIISMVCALCGIFSCADDIAVGNDFLEKAPGGDVTEDTVFSNAEYTRQYLVSIYRWQYFGLTYGYKAGVLPLSNDGWGGKMDALTDCYQLHWKNTNVFVNYYEGYLTSAGRPVFDYSGEFTWEAIHGCFNFLEHIDNVPGMGESEKAKLKAEAYCLIATRYFDMFQFYGGLPLVTHTYTGTEGTYQEPRATAEETVEYILSYLDKAIDTPSLPWAYEDDEALTETGRWTKAGAMALKCRVLQFAASPLFNADKGYYGGSSEAEQQKLVWYGEYKPEYWTKLKTACEAFFDTLNRKGHYKLYEAAGTRPEDYRLAFRHAYFDEASPEVIHSTRVSTTNLSNWYYWLRIGRVNYNPTQEYVEMFPWKDGTPFDWKKDSINGRLDTMFLAGDTVKGSQTLQNLRLTRDPRLYESCVVNLLPYQLDWSTGNMSGNVYELWVGGSDAEQAPILEDGQMATGYTCMKFTLGSGSSTDYQGLYGQWPTIRLSDIYLTYAEALIQADGNCKEALTWIDKVRARVGLKGLAESNSDKNLTSNTQMLLEELMRERACEFAMENQRYFDLIRYKRTDIFETPLHGLYIYRQVKDENGEWQDSETMWRSGNRREETSMNYKTKPAEPTHFRYQKFTLNNAYRYWWKNGYDPKWLLAPINVVEINKDYGLIQNPGW